MKTLVVLDEETKENGKNMMIWEEEETGTKKERRIDVHEIYIYKEMCKVKNI